MTAALPPGRRSCALWAGGRGVGATTPTSPLSARRLHWLTGRRGGFTIYVVIIIEPAEGGPFSEVGNPAIQDNFWIPARRSAVAGMTSDKNYAASFLNHRSCNFPA